MKLVAAQLPEGESPFSFSSSKDAWLRELVADLATQGSPILSPLEINLKLTKLEPDYYLKGELTFEVEQCCARCAESFGLKAKYPFALALVHTKPNQSRTEKKKKPPVQEEESQDLDITYFDGPDIELAPIVREQFFLSLPYQAVCKKDCRGICQTCGKNLNQENCGCHGTLGTPSPFDALKDFKTSI